MNSSALTSLPLRASRKILGSSRLLETILSPNGLDGYGEMFDATFSLRDVRAEVVKVERQNARSATITLSPNSNWQGFQAGQHIGAIVELDGVLHTRFYSVASDAANSDLVELTVSRQPDGLVTGHLIETARPGMVIGLSQAEGDDFLLPQPRPERIVLIGGGSGITPVMSMLRTLVGEGYAGRIDFVRISRSEADSLYTRELEAIARASDNVELTRIFTREKVTGCVHGHLTHAKLKKALGEGYEQAAAFICGPPTLIKGAEQIWQAQGAADQLSTETFALPEIEIAEEDIGGRLHFSESAVETVSNGGTLLDQAEAAGISAEAGCRMGICHTCVAHVEEGVVRDVRTGELRVVKDEYIQTCIHVPVGEFAIDL